MRWPEVMLGAILLAACSGSAVQSPPANSTVVAVETNAARLQLTRAAEPTAEPTPDATLVAAATAYAVELDAAIRAAATTTPTAEETQEAPAP